MVILVKAGTGLHAGDCGGPEPQAGFQHLPAGTVPSQPVRLRTLSA